MDVPLTKSLYTPVQISASEGSLDYAFRHLSYTLLFIIGHSGCDTVKAAMEDYSNKSRAIKTDLDLLKPAMMADDKMGSFEKTVGGKYRDQC